MGKRERGAPVKPAHRANEIGAIHKDPGGKLNVLLVFPNTYFVGMSNLGFHAIYAALNSLEHVRCERAFMPDESSRGVASVQMPLSIESGDMPSRFDVIAFSMPFENDYPNLVRFLKLSGIAIERDGRSVGGPLVVAGGCAVSANPEPLATFVDAFLIGDGERAACEVAALLFEAKEKRLDRRDLLPRLAELDGVYAPEFFAPEYGPDGAVLAIRGLGGRDTVGRRATSREELVPARTVVFTEDTEFGHLGLVEAARGCPRSCSFCMTAFCSRPARFLSAESILNAAELVKEHRPAVGLLGSAVADHPDLLDILSGLLSAGMGVTVSSLRADRINPQMLDLLRRGGQQTITIAPEAGEERLRAALSKPCSDEQLFEAAAQVASAGFPVLKLYFMVGLPGESLEDVEKIVSLVKQMKHGLRKRSSGKRSVMINVSVGSFVPKAHTPFQWEPMLVPGELSRRIRTVRAGLSGTRGVSAHSDVPKWAFVQGVLSRGDRRCSRLVSALAETDFDWQTAHRMVDVNPDFYALRERPRDEVFPWAHIVTGVPMDELWRNLESYRSQMRRISSAAY
ncbi:MAG: radical SAM protein [Candidatus Coatesbacteria bacterium]|nr:radical SAM protein [Candidatus Coatesbacteria bacterium]